jgi:putative spermidine/putrescine transport system permease protein
LVRTGIGLIYLFLLGPILIVVASSFSADSGTFSPTRLSLRWYREFFASESFTSAFQFSIGLGLAAAVIATAIGFFTSYSIARFGVSRHRVLAQSFALLPTMVPQILIGMSLLLALTVFPLPELAILLAGHVLICLPFAIAGITASLDGVDPRLEAAAMTLGASRVRTLWEVVVPLAAPGLLSAFLFAFIVSFSDVYISLFLSGPGMTTLQIEVFSAMQWESTPVVAAITSLQILMIIGLGLAVERLVGLRRVMRF